MKNLLQTREVKSGLISEHDITRLFDSDSCISYIHHDKYPLVIGPRMLLKVNTNIGVSDITNLEIELRKLKYLAGLKYAPDGSYLCSCRKTIVEVYGGGISRTCRHFTSLFDF